MKHFFLATLATLTVTAQLQAGTFDNPYEEYVDCSLKEARVGMMTHLTGGMNAQFQPIPYVNTVYKVDTLKITDKNFLKELNDKNLAKVDQVIKLSISAQDLPVSLINEPGGTQLRKQVVINEDQQSITVQYARILPRITQCTKEELVPFFSAHLIKCVESVEISPEKELSSATLRLDLKSCL